MLYELSIAFSSVIVSFVLYFIFLNFSESKNRNDEIDDNDVIFDERHDLDGKELLLVSVVRIFVIRMIFLSRFLSSKGFFGCKNVSLNIKLLKSFTKQDPLLYSNGFVFEF